RDAGRRGRHGVAERRTSRDLQVEVAVFGIAGLDALAVLRDVARSIESAAVVDVETTGIGNGLILDGAYVDEIHVGKAGRHDETHRRSGGVVTGSRAPQGEDRLHVHRKAHRVRRGETALDTIHVLVSRFVLGAHGPEVRMTGPELRNESRP